MQFDVIPFFFAFALTLILTLFALKFFPYLNLVDRPEKYGLKRKPIPYYGGLTIFFSFVIATLIFLPLSREVLGLLLGASLLTIVSFFDDYRGLPVIFRLLIQVLSASILVFSGIGITEISNPFGGVLSLEVFWLAEIFTIVWIVVITNAVNWLDGVPGLSPGVGTLAALVIFFLAVRPDFHFFDQSAVITLAAIIVGCALAFTIFNFPPPRILFGDTGSILLGFVLAALAIFSGGKIATAVLVLGLPILDFGFVIVRRILSKRSPLQGDLSHLHHRFLAAGLSKCQTVLIFYLIAGLFGLSAIFIPHTFGKLVAFLVLLSGFWVLVFSLRNYRKLERES